MKRLLAALLLLAAPVVQLAVVQLAVVQPAHAGTSGAALQIRGADVSSLAKSEALGGVYRDARGRRGERWASCRGPGSTTSGSRSG
ncbi:hypothetical protein [Nonomuraea sp. B1E8]|uniref:hypothetical protein n=1 Tax=unclassified Nonomuraea TaxID=2593643 RepID=UPI00325E5613